MNELDYEVFDIRELPEWYEKEVVPSQIGSHREFRSLAKTVFSHMRAVFHDNLPDKDEHGKMAQHFYRECYAVPQISEYDSDQAVSLDSYLNRLIDGLSDGHRNHISFLVGKVGTGKTAFVNYLITSAFPKMWESEKFWFIRFDLEDDGGREVFAKEEALVLGFCRKLSRIVRENGFLKDPEVLVPLDACVAKLESTIRFSKLSKVSPTLQNDIADTLARLETALKDVVHSIHRETSRRLLVIFDNIDYILHVHDRVICRDEQDTTMDVFQLEDLRRFVQRFERAGVLRELNATILMVTREDSFRIMRQAWSLSLKPEIMSCFALEVPKWRVILEARRKLMDWAVDSIPHDGKREQFAEILDIIRTDTERPDSEHIALIDRLIRLGNCGFRQVVDFLSLYPFIGHNAAHESNEVVHRFLHHAPVAQIAFCLGKKCLFSQNQSLFPNIYLVYLPPTEADDASAQNADLAHGHSYWLKRLILETIKQKPNLLPSTLRAMFAGTNGYDDAIVRACIGSLHEVRSACLIYAEREKHPDPAKKELRISKIGLTERASYCLDDKVKLFDRFFYLQLVVDDYLLHFPASLLTHFDFQKGHDYTYLVANTDEYFRRAGEMIRVKAKQVVIFLECLEAYWEIETVRYRGTFERLRNKKIVLPDIRRIKESVWAEINTLNNYYEKTLLGELTYLKKLAFESRQKIDRDFSRYLPPKI